MCKVLCWQRDEGTRERKHITVVPSLFPTVHLNKSQEEDFTSLFFSHHFLKKPKLNSTHAWSTATSTWIYSSSSSRYPRQQGNLPSRLQRWISNWLEKMHEPLASSGSKDRQLSPSEFLPGTLHSRLLIRLTLSVPSQNTLPNGSEVWLRSLASIASLKFKNWLNKMSWPIATESTSLSWKNASIYQQLKLELSTTIEPKLQKEWRIIKKMKRNQKKQTTITRMEVWKGGFVGFFQVQRVEQSSLASNSRLL